MAKLPAKQKTRVVKKVETVRELTEKQGIKSIKKTAEERGMFGLTLYFIGWPFRLLGRGLAKLSRFKALRFISRLLWPKYFRNSWKELRQVTWPTGRESIQLTGAVLLFSAIFGIMIALVDYGLDKLFKQVLLK